MRPVIAIAPQLELDQESYAARRRYATFIEQCGGAAVVLAPAQSDEDLASILNACDGLLLAGGADVEASRYGAEALDGCDTPQPERDDLEMSLVRLAKAAHMPFLGICRGLQVANVTFGGTLHQRVADSASNLQHWQPEPYDVPSHAVDVLADTLLARILPAGTIEVNSMHHQGVDALGASLEAAAVDPCGFIESAYAPDENFFLGVQWHPEYAPALPESIAVGRAFVDACARFHERRSLGAGTGSLTANHRYTAEYLMLAQKLDPQGDDRRRTWEYLESSTSKYDGITVFSSSLPRLFDQTTYDTFKNIAETTYRILCKVVDAYRTDPAYRSIFGYDARAEELILLPCGYTEPLPLMRVDLFLDEDTLEARFCEFNSDGSSGMNENREITLGVQPSSIYRAFAQHHRVRDCVKSLFEGWVDEFLRIYGTFENRVENPTIAIVDFLDHAVVEEFKVYGHIFEERGYRFAVYDVRELSFDGERLRGERAYYGEDGLTIDAIWRRCISTDVVAQWDESQPLIEAVRALKVALIGSFAGHIVHDKRIFSLLMRPETQTLLTAEENAFLARTIPYTTYLDSTHADLTEVCDNRQDWVIKPLDSYGSQGVYVGLDYDRGEWSRLVDEHRDGRSGTTYLAQRFCNPYPTPAIPLYGKEEDYELPPRSYRNLSGLYVYGGHFAGVFSRQGPQNIILGKKGGVTAPTIWVDTNTEEG